MSESDKDNGSEDELPDLPEVTAKKPFKYTDRDDINLLKEVMVEKPSGRRSASKWRAILGRLKFPAPNYRAIQARFNLLVKAYKSENLKSMRGSGLEEDYDEKCQLLTDILDEMDDWAKTDSTTTASAKRKVNEEQTRAQEIRNAAMNTMDGDAQVQDEEETPIKRRKRSNVNFLDLIQSSENRNFELKQASNEFEKRRLELMERELKLKEENEKHRREMEIRRMEMEEKRMSQEEEKNNYERQEKMLFLKLLEGKVNGSK